MGTVTEHLSQAVLKRLAAFAAALAMGVTPNPAELEAVPEEMISDLLAADVLDDMDDPDRQALLRLLSLDPRPVVRLRVARTFAQQLKELSPQVELALAQLAADDFAPVRQAARRGFHVLLARLDGIERMRLLCEWALSPEVQRRLAVAQALREGVDSPVADAAQRLLGGDPDPEVRALAQTALRA
jgi:hypothetical protein